MITFTNQLAVGQPLCTVSVFFKSGNWVCCEAEAESIRKGDESLQGCFHKQGHISSADP